jgi:hypothetical protein
VGQSRTDFIEQTSLQVIGAARGGDFLLMVSIWEADLGFVGVKERGFRLQG